MIIVILFLSALSCRDAIDEIIIKEDPPIPEESNSEGSSGLLSPSDLLDQQVIRIADSKSGPKRYLASATTKEGNVVMSRGNPIESSRTLWRVIKADGHLYIESMSGAPVGSEKRYLDLLEKGGVKLRNQNYDTNNRYEGTRLKFIEVGAEGVWLQREVADGSKRWLYTDEDGRLLSTKYQEEATVWFLEKTGMQIIDVFDHPTLHYRIPCMLPVDGHLVLFSEERYTKSDAAATAIVGRVCDLSGIIPRLRPMVTISESRRNGSLNKDRNHSDPTAFVDKEAIWMLVTYFKIDGSERRESMAKMIKLPRNLADFQRHRTIQNVDDRWIHIPPVGEKFETIRDNRGPIIGGPGPGVMLWEGTIGLPVRGTRNLPNRGSGLLIRENAQWRWVELEPHATAETAVATFSMDGNPTLIQVKRRRGAPEVRFFSLPNFRQFDVTKLNGFLRDPTRDHSVQVGIVGDGTNLYLSSPRGGDQSVLASGINVSSEYSRQAMCLFRSSNGKKFELIQQIWDGYGQYSSSNVVNTNQGKKLAVMYNYSFSETLHNRMRLAVMDLD